VASFLILKPSGMCRHYNPFNGQKSVSLIETSISVA
jgi:hypothetical protein